MLNCYFSNISLDFVWFTTGFHLIQYGNYYLPWVKVQPPALLIWSLWSWVDQWWVWFNQAFDNSVFTDLYEKLEFQSMQLSEENWIDLAGQGFLCLLNDLCMILLQDSVILCWEFSQHSVWQSPIFVQNNYI